MNQQAGQPGGTNRLSIPISLPAENSLPQADKSKLALYKELQTEHRIFMFTANLDFLDNLFNSITTKLNRLAGIFDKTVAAKGISEVSTLLFEVIREIAISKLVYGILALPANRGQMNDTEESRLSTAEQQLRQSDSSVMNMYNSFLIGENTTVTILLEDTNYVEKIGIVRRLLAKLGGKEITPYLGKPTDAEKSGIITTFVDLLLANKYTKDLVSPQ